MFPGEAQPTKASLPVLKVKKAAATPDRKFTPTTIAEFDANPPSFSLVDADGLNPSLFPEPASDAALIASWGIRVDGVGPTVANIAAFMAHPVTAMLLEILGRNKWTWADAKLWLRRSGRNWSAQEVMDVYRVYVDDFEKGNGERLRNKFRSADRGNRAPYKDPMAQFGVTEHYFPFAECIERAQNLASAIPVRPAALEDFKAFYEELNGIIPATVVPADAPKATSPPRVSYSNTDSSETSAATAAAGLGYRKEALAAGETPSTTHPQPAESKPPAFVIPPPPLMEDFFDEGAMLADFEAQIDALCEELG